MHEQPSAARENNPLVEREPTDVNVRAILWFVVFLVGGGAVVLVAMWWMKEALLAREQAASPVLTPLAERESMRLPRDMKKLPAPRLHTDDRQERQELREYEKEKLTRYGWVDRKNGIVRVPIERAMKLVLDEGLPARAP